MKYWLVKSEGDCYSIDDLKKEKVTSWTGVRNFQARNYMRDDMKKGDLVLYYHSNSLPNGVYGIAKVVSEAHEDETALDPNDEHYDPDSIMNQFEKKDPTWVCVDLSFVKKFKNVVSLEEIKKHKTLKSMLVAKTGQRLSVMPVEKEHYDIVEKMGN